ncbi:MAG: hypothetical protein JWQ38_532 [Flavipsychrobacter sp.]|nr:hypothetical protein [Flavipsychrobacter sp.]
MLHTFFTLHPQRRQSVVNNSLNGSFDNEETLFYMLTTCYRL